MKTQIGALGALAIALTFGTALHWPLFLKVITIVLSGVILSGVVRKLISTHQKEHPDKR